MNGESAKEKRNRGWGRRRGSENKPLEEGQGSMLKSTSAGFRYSSLGKEERMGGDSDTNLEHKIRIPRLFFLNLQKSQRRLS